MKKLVIATMLFMGMVITGFAQSTKVIALVNKASWCHVCMENAPRFEKDIVPMVMQNKNVQILINDLSDATTKDASLPILQKAGIEKFASKNSGTGMLYFIDAKTKKLISEVSLAEKNEQIKNVYMAALTKIKI
ncbi:hypothetical protein [Pedobacter sp.]|uniref:hypothetical protein n=1 Tax=Pedobacter sp. TaxID=1411316 RepID=UPI003C529BCE